MEDVIDFNNSVILHTQDMEEAEELEERKRREEEMHSLISQALGHFDFDEQSTINSSIRSDDEDVSMEPLNNKYRETTANEQLKVLYDIRVHEVENLNKQMEKLKFEFKEQEKGYKRQIALFEAENQRKTVSLRESQNLREDENSVLRQLNMDLEQQRILSQNGFPLKSAVADKEFQESQRNKIDQLEKALSRMMEEIEHKDRKCEQLEEEFKRNICNRDNDLLQKNVVINTLTDNNERLLWQYQELLKVTNEQKEKLQSTNNHHLEKELNKIREKEKLETLSKEIRSEVTKHFETHLSLLKCDNQTLKDELSIKEKEFSDLYKEMQALSAVNVEKCDLENNIKKLYGTLNEMTLEKDVLVKKLKVCEDEKKLLENQQTRFITENQLVKVLKTENENLQKMVTDLQVSHCRDERSVQTSLPFVNNQDYTNSQEQLSTAHNRIVVLENQVKHLQEENSQLQVKIGLEKERESLIRKLQQKAAEFEKIIQKRQKHNKGVSVGTNTSHEYDSSLLKVQHETLLYQTETKLLQKLKKEYDEKLSKAISEHNTLRECKKCVKLQEECEKLNDLRQQDRDAVLNLFTMWEDKFLQLEKDNENGNRELVQARAEVEQIALYSKQALADYKEKYQKAEQLLQKSESVPEDNGNDKRELIAAKLEAEQMLAGYKDKHYKTVEQLKKNAESTMQDQKQNLTQASIRNCQIISRQLSKLKAKIYEDNEKVSNLVLNRCYILKPMSCL
ncbi:hypothetical protein RI129_008999 [Pyrocoelia pectoralis]|uniref:Uncharacterized protein n=1 Tax=Pyrocoelia pectoralis TaxID=417401 RepID=A0AAN7ZHY6_9COLE